MVNRIEFSLRFCVESLVWHEISDDDNKDEVNSLNILSNNKYA